MPGQIHSKAFETNFRGLSSWSRWPFTKSASLAALGARDSAGWHQNGYGCNWMKPKKGQTPEKDCVWVKPIQI